MKLVILDGNSVINRAYYGIRPLTTRDGLYTNGIFGFLNIMQKVEHEENPDALCVAFDLHGPTFRHLRYDGYKANRHGMPEELAMQMPVMKQVLTAMNIPIYECQGWEADDVIGTVARICGEKDWHCVILTGDRDSLQLVDDHVTVKLVHTRRGQTIADDYTPEVFRAEYGMEPIRLIDLKALMGDTSDNIPGVAGVGPKTAEDLLHRFGTLDGVYENLTHENMRGKLYEKLEKDKENAYLSYELATIRCDAPIEFSPENNMIQAPNKKDLRELFVRLEFQKLMDRYHLRDVEPEEETAEFVPCPCQNAECTEALLVKFRKADHVSLLAGENDVTVHCEGKSYRFACLPEELFTDKIKKVTHDSKPLMRRLMEKDLPADGFIFDTAVAAYLLDATRGKYELSQITSDYLHEESEDVSAVEALYPILREKLREQGTEKLYDEIEFPLCYVLARMEADGVAVDREALQSFGEMLTKRISDCEEIIYGYAGGEFNINSPKQLGEVLFEKLGLPPVKKTKSGYSTNADVLEKLKNKHPIIPAIMDYRMMTKLNSTYAEGLQKVIAEDGRIHSTFQNLVTATGRLSSTDPNLQNIPVRTELGSEIRKMFVPREGWVLVDADYSQIELRVLAHIADDKNMQEAFRSGADFHSVTASQVFGVPVDQVTPLMRRNAKAVNFGIVYGISEFSLAQDIGVTRREAKEYIDSYLSKYHGVRDYMHNIVETARTQGYVSTIFGRRRLIPEIKSSNFNVRSGAERIALNTPVQGSAADIIKLAMVRVFRALQKEDLQAKLILQVHDELIVECPSFEAPQVMEIVTREMQEVLELKVPLIAEAKIGESWYDAK